jgi:hypothetical protein
LDVVETLADATHRMYLIEAQLRLWDLLRDAPVTGADEENGPRLSRETIAHVRSAVNRVSLQLGQLLREVRIERSQQSGQNPLS